MKQKVKDIARRYRALAADPTETISAHNLDSASVWPWLLNDLLTELEGLAGTPAAQEKK
jgi:hypothetical protein